jgi:hypothetical protein
MSKSYGEVAMPMVLQKECREASKSLPTPCSRLPLSSWRVEQIYECYLIEITILDMKR